MSRYYNFFFAVLVFLSAAALFPGCLTPLGSYGEVPEDQRVFLEIESGLKVAFFDETPVNWGKDSFFGGYAEVVVPAGVHTLRVSARKEAADEGKRGIVTNVYTITGEIKVDFLPLRRYRLKEDGSFLDFFLGSYDLNLKMEDISG
jgi:hypothetical protein